MKIIPAFGLALVLVAAAHAAPQPPNIVFIVSDDHAYQAISAYGEERQLLATPNIDRIANGGVRFDRCLVTNSICGPCRATVLTRKYNHLNGFYNNSNCTFDGAQLTFPKLLQKAGYQTAIIGKWHLGSDPTGFDFWQILPGQGVYYNPPMIRNGEKIKVPGYGTGEDYTELFDLQKDPQELRSVYGQPEYAATQAELSRELARLRLELRAPESVPPK